MASMREFPGENPSCLQRIQTLASHLPNILMVHKTFGETFYGLTKIKLFGRCMAHYSWHKDGIDKKKKLCQQYGMVVAVWSLIFLVDVLLIVYATTPSRMRKNHFLFSGVFSIILYQFLSMLLLNGLLFCYSMLDTLHFNTGPGRLLWSYPIT